MAITNFSGISAYYNGKNTFGWTNTLARSAAFPVEKFSVFGSLDDAKKYVNGETIPSMGATAGLAYAGQIIAVANADGSQTVYVVDPTVTEGDLIGLRPLATGGDAAEIEQKLNAEISNRISADNYLSSQISTIQTTTLQDLRSTLTEQLSIDVAVEAGTGDILSSYVISQGGTDKTVKINIPKDKVITNAEVVKNPEGHAAGTYLKLTIQNVADPLYVPVPELASVYSGHDGDTVKVEVVNDPTNGESYTIKASVKAGSIGAEHLTTNLSTYIKTVVDREAADRSAIEILSGADTVEGSVAKAKKDAKAYADTKVEALSTSLSTTVDTKITAEKNRATAAEAALKSDVDNKIFIDGLSAQTLSIMHISQDEYHNVVTSDTGADPNTIYVVSSDSLNLYGEKITNLADGTDKNDAVNVGQLSSVSADLQTKITNAVNGGVNQLSNQIFTPTTGLKDVLSADYSKKAKDAETNAKAYTDQKIENLDYAGGSFGPNQFVTKVTETNGVIEATYARPTANDISFGSNSTVNDALTALQKVAGATSADVSIGGAKKYAEAVALSVANAANAAITSCDFDMTKLTGAAVVDKITQVDGKITQVSTRNLNASDLADYTTLTSDIQNKYAVTIKQAAGTTEGVLSTYTVAQNGKTLATIEIPKDKVIESAKVVFGTLSGDGFHPEDAGSATKSDKAKFYLEVVVANQDKKLYIPVPELADTYVGHTGTTVSVKIVSDKDGARCISAEVNDGSIGEKHLTEGLSAYINANRKAIEALSGNGQNSVKKQISDLSTALSGDIDALSGLIFAENGLKDQLSGEIESLSSALSGDIKDLSSSLSGTVDTISAGFDKRIDALEVATVSAITINNVKATVANNEIVFSGIIFDCGNAADLT